MVIPFDVAPGLSAAAEPALAPGALGTRAVSSLGRAAPAA